VIYLFCVVVMTLVSAVRLILNVWKREMAHEREALVGSSSESIWDTCHFKIRSIRNFSHLTCLLSVLVLSLNATNLLASVIDAKASAFPYVAAGLADALVPFGLGIGICSAQISCAMFLEALVRNRRLMVHRKAGKVELPDE
jgi:hypothetical protein